MRMEGRFLSAMVLAVCMLFATASIAAAAGQVNWYSGFSREMSEALAAGFTKKHPDIKVVTYRAGIEEILGKFFAEAKAGAVNADVILGGIVPIDLKEQGLLLPYVSPNTKQMPTDQITKAFGPYTDGSWTPVAFWLLVIGYNTNEIPAAKAPKALKQFIEPQYKGKIVFGDPRKTGTALFTVYGLYKLYGWDFIKKLRDNDPLIVAGSGEANKYLVMGERPLYLPSSDRILIEMTKGEKVKDIWAEEGAIPGPMPAFIPKGAKNLENAKLFIDYLTSKEAQEEISKVHCLHPVRGDVAPPGKYPGIDKIKIIAPDFEWIAQNKNLIKEEFWKRME